jgi:hypothetical protein
MNTVLRGRNDDQKERGLSPCSSANITGISLFVEPYIQYKLYSQLQFLRTLGWFGIASRVAGITLSVLRHETLIQ